MLLSYCLVERALDKLFCISVISVHILYSVTPLTVKALIFAMVLISQIKLHSFKTLKSKSLL